MHWSRHRLMIVVCLTLVVLLLAACGGKEAAAPSATATEASATTPEATQAEETAATEETAAAEEVAATEETAAEAVPVAEAKASPSAAYRILVIGDDGHHREDVTKVLATVAGKIRKGDFLDLKVGGKHTVSWMQGNRKIEVINYADLAKTKEGIADGPWAGALVVSDPAITQKNQKEFFAAATGAGIRRVVFFQVVSDLLTDMEVYDLEAQVWPDELDRAGFEGTGTPTLQANVARAAAGDAKERKAIEDLVRAIETHLAE